MENLTHAYSLCRINIDEPAVPVASWPLLDGPTRGWSPSRLQSDPTSPNWFLFRVQPPTAKYCLFSLIIGCILFNHCFLLAELPEPQPWVCASRGGKHAFSGWIFMVCLDLVVLFQLGCGCDFFVIVIFCVGWLSSIPMTYIEPGWKDIPPSHQVETYYADA